MGQLSVIPNTISLLPAVPVNIIIKISRYKIEYYINYNVNNNSRNSITRGV